MKNNWPHAKSINESNSTYYCKNCSKRISSNDKICPNCKQDLGKTGRHISIAVSDYIKLSEKTKTKIPIDSVKWDAQSLTLLGVFITLFLGMLSVLETRSGIKFIYAISVSFMAALLFFVLVTKIERIKNTFIKIINWFLK